MSVNKLKSGKYQARVKTPAGEVKTKCFSKKLEARKWEISLRQDFDHDGSVLFNCEPHKTVYEASLEWFNRKVVGRNAPKTLVAYKGSIDKYIVPLLGPERIGSLRETHADAFIRILREVPLKPKTINRHIMVLRMILKFCAREDWIVKSPFERIDLLPEDNPEIDFLNKGEVEQLLIANLGNRPVYSLLMIALNSGMRSGEICGLCWDCVDFDRNLLHIRRTKTKEGLAERTKTKRSRFVPMNSSLRSFLEKLWVSRWDSQFVIVNEKGKALDQSHISNRLFREALAKANVRRVRFHDLRHTYASHFMMNGGNIYELQKILGHSKADMTMKYAHLSPDFLVQASNTVQFGAVRNQEFPKSFHGNLRILK